MLPTEKVYSHTDRPFYFPGETIWFKSYVINESNLATTTSDVLVAELISPKGTVLKTKKLSIRHGFSYGDFAIREDWVGGVYTLRMYTNYMKNFGHTSFFTKKITVQKVVVPKLLFKLKFQKEAYGKGSTVKANFEVKDLENNPLDTKEVIAKVRVSGMPFLSKKLLTDQSGKKEITFRLPENLITSDVVLNVQVPYEGSMESISRSVPIILDNIDLQFFPEGGKSIEGAQNKVAFKALNEFGKPADVSGLILDEAGTVKGTFNSFHDGMGLFEMPFKAASSHFAKITQPFLSDSLYAIPPTQAKGLKISLNKRENQATVCTVFSSEDRTGSIQVMASDKVLYEKKLSISKGSEMFVVPTSEFPAGICKFRFLDTGGNPISERLVYLNADKTLKLSLKPNKTQYGPREKVLLEIETTNFENKPISANLSVAVSDNALISFADDKQDHILSSLLVSSELKGKIYKPAFYFDKTEEKAERALELLMLTHGWRDYLINPVSREKANFFPQKRNMTVGTVTDSRGNPIPAQLMLFERNGEKVLKFKTNEVGQFSFKMEDKTSYVLVAYREDERPLRIVRKIINTKPSGRASKAIISRKSTRNKEPRFKKGDNSKPLKEAIEQKAEISTSLEEDAQSLDEVVVLGYGVSSTKQALGFAQASVYTEELSGDIDDLGQLLQGRVAGVQITRNSGASGSGTHISIRGSASLRGANEALYIIDGVPYGTFPSGLEDAETAVLDPSNIESIHVLKGVTATALYGARGANGVIVINTNAGNYRGEGKVLLRHKYKNYAISNIYSSTTVSSLSLPNKFYMPVYDAEEAVSERLDFRPTIYWNPVVQTDAEGKATLEFYNSDALSSFKITAEGIGYNGLVGRNELAYSIQSPLTVTSKLPNYSTLNDTIVLPITLSNNTQKAIKAKVQLRLSKHFKLIDSGVLRDSIRVNSKSFVIKNVRITPVKKGTDAALRVMVSSLAYTDSFKKETEVLSPYFPTETSISSSKNGAYTFDVDQLVPNTLSAEFNIYLDVVGDVMNGIASLIRKPYGCFEQTSSATYPNVMILKYLKESGKAAPEIEEKALKFISQGYKRLTSFETKEGGFEWFGNTPPHETLTAFGILEFTEMKEVYDKVDQKMIERTAKWLLGRKDGLGGFKKSKKGYDSFASSPKKVADAYIVYALSEAGYGAQIEKEYNTALKKALKSEDYYRMALLALASKNFDDKPAHDLLIEKIAEGVKKYGFGELPVENTITRSYGKSKHMETTAFVILALLRENKMQDDVAEGIEFLLNNRDHGRFGSTQATAMSLKALIEYTKQQKEKLLSANDTFELILNGTQLSSKLSKTSDGIFKIEGLQEYINEGRQRVSFAFNSPEKAFPYSLDVRWDSFLPGSSKNCKVKLATTITNKKSAVGDIVRMNIEVENKEDNPLPMTTSIIGIPSGASLQPYQLKELLDAQQCAYYEVFDNYLVLYWLNLEPKEKKHIALDLKAEIAGSYKAPASTAYLYYTDEDKHWISGSWLKIETVGTSE